MNVRTVWIADIHLGIKGCQAEVLKLSRNDCRQYALQNSWENCAQVLRENLMMVDEVKH